VAVFPFLKYPGNPPGVGEPDTIGYRQALYLGFIALSVLGLVLAAALRRRATAKGAGGWIAPVAFYAVWAVGLYALMPPNPDPVELSETIVRPFRALSLAGLVVFWAAFALAPCGSASRQTQQGAGHHRFAVVDPSVGEPQIPKEVSLAPVG
jgi:hypothetical protein